MTRPRVMTMRWNETIVLIVAAKPYQDSEGAQHKGSETTKTVFCNSYSVGTAAFNTSRELRLFHDIGMRPMSSVQLRSCDYNNEMRVVYRGEPYDVAQVTERGEIVTLLLERHVSNG